MSEGEISVAARAATGVGQHEAGDVAGRDAVDARLRAILERQRAAFLRDGPPTLEMRKERLKRLRALVLRYRGEVGEAISADFGHRSHHETDLMEMVGSIQSIDYQIRTLRRFMKPERRHVGLMYQPGRARVIYQPKGVVGVMAPWNYPFYLCVIPLATALAAGNRAMIKPSELTPCASEVIRRMLADGFDEEEVAVITGGPEVGAAFSALPFDHLLFTGSTGVGRKVMRAASDNLVPLTLELGGKSPVIVARGHADRRAVDSIAFGKLVNAGQTCIAPDYALVHADDLDGFVTQFGEATRRLYPQGPASPDYTSIVNERHFARVQRLLDDARAKGARVVETGAEPGRAAERPHTLAPTLVLDATPDMAVMQEEIFGPVLPVCTWREPDEVIGRVNAGPRPLALYYFGPQDDFCERLLAQTTSGNVCVNNTMLHVAQDDLPFGGIGPSGMGAYHGVEGFRAMSHAKGVFYQGRWDFTALARAPFGKFADFALKLTLGKAADGPRPR